MEFGYKVDSIGYIEFCKCFFYIDKYVSLLFGLVDSVFYLYVFYSYIDQLFVFFVLCSGVMGLKKSSYDIIFFGGFFLCYIIC